MMTVEQLQSEIQSLPSQDYTRLINWVMKQYATNQTSQPSNAAQQFFATHEPIQSFRETDPTEYINNLRQNSRILKNSGEMNDN